MTWWEWPAHSKNSARSALERKKTKTEQMLSSHPDSDERAAQVKAWAKKDGLLP